ncbi:FAD/NAD(P)-binding protein [Kitasatospora sp. NPDC004272]
MSGPGGGRPWRAADLGAFVQSAARAGELVVQPRMGMARPQDMAAGVAAVAALAERTVATITLDSYTRVGDHAAAAEAIRSAQPLNGFPLVSHGPETSARVAAQAGPDTPVQVRHGSADPRAIFRTMVAAGLTASEGGPVSYCLPYGRTPLAESVTAWREAVRQLATDTRARGARAHLETFGGCLLGQLCPPSLLVAVSVLEALFFVQNGITSVSLSYAQQTHADQDAGALTALRLLADELLPAGTDRHLVLYTYMGVFPRTPEGARLLLARSTDLAVRGGAQRIIVKTEAEAHRIPTLGENLAALRRAAARARAARSGPAPAAAIDGPDTYEVLTEARALVTAVLSLADDVGTALLRAFHRGTLDIPYCLHPDNRGGSRSVIADDGRLRWAAHGAMPLFTTGTRNGTVTADRLAAMLRRTADLHDLEARPAEEPRPGVPAAPPRRPRRIVVVGTGPRGLSVLERLAARAAERPAGNPVRVQLVDPYPAGPGRVWRTDQSPRFLMNTAACEVTMFSGPADDGPARPGAGPSLAEWWAGHDPEHADPDGYAPRAVYGAYLEYVLARITATLPPDLTVEHVPARVLSADRVPGTGEDGGTGYRLRLDRGDVLTADRLVLATGHPAVEPSDEQNALVAFAAAHPPLRCIVGESAADMPLALIPPGSAVGVLGMGLTFYDVLAELTLGRGGRFQESDTGLRYLPSGREPRIVPASRSGVPLMTRGVNQKSPGHRYRAVLFTPERMAALRAAGPVDFHAAVLPWLMAEVNLVLLGTRVRRAAGAAAAEEFTERVRAAHARPPAARPEPPEPAALARTAAEYGADTRTIADLSSLARPFAGRRFRSAAEYRTALAEHLRADLDEAGMGNLGGPLKAACDTLRDVRQTIRGVVDFGGLTPTSHQRFLHEFAPLAALVSTGPPPLRSEQFLALMDAGVLDPVGPRARFQPDQANGCFTVASDQVDAPGTRLDTLIDARVPSTDLRADRDPLIRGLIADGTIRTFVNSWAGHSFDTGGLASTDAPFHPVRACGTVERGMHVIGIPSEHTRWFTQVGSGRPGPWGSFTRDADDIARALLEPLPGPAAPAARPADAVAGGSAG